MPGDLIEVKYENGKAIASLLEEKGEASLLAEHWDDLRKALLLSAASAFEARIVSAIREFGHRVSRGCDALGAFVYKKGLARQYHTLFQWEGNSVNSFLGLFGATFGERVKSAVKADETLLAASKDFLAIGLARNQLAHGDYAAFVLDLTVDEILLKYRSAAKFVEFMEAVFAEECCDGAEALPAQGLGDNSVGDSGDAEGSGAGGGEVRVSPPAPA